MQLLIKQKLQNTTNLISYQTTKAFSLPPEIFCPYEIILLFLNLISNMFGAQSKFYQGKKRMHNFSF